MATITIPKNVTTIGDEAFENCKAITSVEIPENINDLGSQVFNGCSALKSVNIIGKVKKINSAAFKGCESLTSISFPEGMKSIGNDALRDCKSLEKVAKKVDVLCVCDQMPFGCITEAVRRRICELGSEGLTVIVDSRDRIGLYSNVIVKPNEIEASRTFKGKVKPTAFEELARLLESRTERPAIVTAGEKGCYVSEGGRVTHVQACKVTGEIDFCGAGDTFLSAVACSTAAGFPLADAAAIACAASAVTIKKLKTTGTATREEIVTRLEELG